jgi:hypothetical protein
MSCGNKATRRLRSKLHRLRSEVVHVMVMMDRNLVNVEVDAAEKVLDETY